MRLFKNSQRPPNGRAKGKAGWRAALRERAAAFFDASFAANALFVGVVALVTVHLAGVEPLGLRTAPYEEGAVSSHTVRSDREFRVEDPHAAAIEKREAMERGAPLFVLDGLFASILTDGARAVFRRGRVFLATGEKEPPESLRKDFEELFGKGALFQEAMGEGFSSQLDSSVLWLSI